MIERLKILKTSKGQFANNSELSERLKNDEALRKEVETLSRAFLNKTVSGCNNCYADAYYELINLDIQKAMDKEKCQFKLRAGALLRDINGDIGKNMTQANITDDLSLYHLKTNPNNKRLFHTLPESLDKLLEEFKLPEGAKVIEEKKAEEKLEVSPEIEAEFNRMVDHYEQAIGGLKEDLEEKGNIISEQDIEISALKNQIAELSGHELAGETKTASQEEIENEFISTISEQLKAGETKTAIKKQYSSVENVGDVKLTTRALADFIKKAEELNNTQE